MTWIKGMPTRPGHYWMLRQYSETLIQVEFTQNGDWMVGRLNGTAINQVDMNLSQFWPIVKPTLPGKPVRMNKPLDPETLVAAETCFHCKLHVEAHAWLSDGRLPDTVSMLGSIAQVAGDVIGSLDDYVGRARMRLWFKDLLIKNSEETAMNNFGDKGYVVPKD